MSSGDVEGFAAVAFPLVRRVFGSLIANDLVSVQPMSLPSGLIFFLDFTFPVILVGSTAFDRMGYAKGKSVYGGGCCRCSRSPAVLTSQAMTDSNAEVVLMPLTTVIRLRRVLSTAWRTHSGIASWLHRYRRSRNGRSCYVATPVAAKTSLRLCEFGCAGDINTILRL